MNKQETRERIILTIKEAISNNLYFVQDNKHPDEYDAVIDSNDVDHIAEQSAEELIEAGYINGADFVEWLKDKAVWTHGVGTFYESDFDNALQEYLKGE